MKILLFEDNLMWTSRLMQSVKGLGHEGEILTVVPHSTDAPVAIVNLAASRYDPTAVVPALRALGVHVIGHAGHKEKDLLQLGREAGCSRLATNSELTYKIESLLKEACGS